MHKCRTIVHLVATAVMFWPSDGFTQSAPADLSVITNEFGLCLDIKEARAYTGTPVQAYPCNGTPAQAWTAGLFGLRSLLSAQFYLATKDAAAIVAEPRDEFWMLQEHRITDGSRCLSAPRLSGMQLTAQTCEPVGISWFATPLVATLQNDDLSTSLKYIPVKVMRARHRMLVTVKDGRLSQNGQTFKSRQIQSWPQPSDGMDARRCEIPFLGGARWGAWYTTYYVLTTDYALYMVNACGKDPILPGEEGPMVLAHDRHQINHAALANASSVLAAGEVDVTVDGRLAYIDNCSGHYRPSQYSLLFVVNWLASQGLQGLPPHGLRVEQLVPMAKSPDNMQVSVNVRAGTGDCHSYAALRAVAVP